MRGISRETRCEMSKKINIMGICLDNYSVRESRMRLDTYMSSTVLNIIETVTMEQLILAGENPAIKECLEQADLCIIGEREILTETGTDSAQRVREVCGQEFLQELLGRAERSRKRIFLLAETDVEIEYMKETFGGLSAKFTAAGCYAAETCGGDLDAIVNEINGATPDVVISALASPMEEEFVLSHKDKVGAGIWYGIGSSYDLKKKKVGRTIKKLFLKGRLRHFVSKYESENKDRI